MSNGRDLFIEKAKVRYGNTYDYSQVNYVNMTTKVVIVCRQHGPFERTPSYHLRGGECPVCTKIRMAGYWTPEKRAEASKRWKDGDLLAKRKETMRQKYGTDSWAKSDDAKLLQQQGEGPWSVTARKKAAETNIEKFGAKTWAESDVGRDEARRRCSDLEVRQHMSEIASSPEVREKVKQTSLSRFGAEHWAKSDEGKARLHEMFSTAEVRLQRRQLMLSPEVRQKIEETGLRKYGVPYYWQSDEGRARLRELLMSEEVMEKTRQTNLARYGSETWQSSDVGKRALASEEVLSKRRATCMERYGAESWSESEEGRKFLGSSETLQKIHDSKIENGTYGRSAPEELLYSMLCEHFSVDDIRRQYNTDDRYPWSCDFYIVSRDLFIELNAYWSHGFHWFDKNNDADLEKLQLWMSKSSSGYEDAIMNWTVNDVAKREAARNHRLNYVVFWRNDLKDAKDWFLAGCPLRHDWE